MEFKEVKIEIYIPEEYVVNLRDELNKVNAGHIGKYDNCISYAKTKGYWRPLDGSNPLLREFFIQKFQEMYFMAPKRKSITAFLKEKG